MKENLSEEILQFAELTYNWFFFSYLYQNIPCEVIVIPFNNNSLEICFLNVEIAFRIDLSRMVTNYEGKRAFSKLKSIKNKLKNTGIL